MEAGILNISYQRICYCEPNRLNCLTPKEWLKCQLGIWQFSYDSRDIRDKNLHNEQLLRVEQYPQDPRDLGTLDEKGYKQAVADILADLLPLLRPKGHCVINVPDMWWEDRRITLHITVIEALRQVAEIASSDRLSGARFHL